MPKNDAMVTLAKFVYFALVIACFGIGLGAARWAIPQFGRAMVDFAAVAIGSLALIPATLAFTSLIRRSQGRIEFFTGLDDKEPIFWLAFTPLFLATASGLSLAARWHELNGA